jgi:hypothetical protein
MNSISTLIGKMGLGHEPLFETDDLAVELAGLSSMIFIPKHLKIQPKCQTYSNNDHQAWKEPKS